MRFRSYVVTWASIYLLIAALINLYYGFNLFFGGAVALVFAGPSGVALSNDNSSKFTIDPTSGLMTLLGAFLLVVGILMVVNAIALFARKEGSRTRTMLVVLLSILACLFCIVNTLVIQWIPLIIGLIVLLFFTFDQPLRSYFQRRTR